MFKLQVISIPQADCGMRYLAVDRSSWDAVRRDRAMLDHIGIYACLDVDRWGRETWMRPLGSSDATTGRAAIRAHLSGGDP